jgi:hypothetical protein
MKAAFTAAFGAPGGFSAEREKCVYPVALLNFRDASALITQEGEPGAACHACGAELTANVLRPEGARFAHVKTFDKFASTGSFATAGTLTATRLGGDDAFLVAHGGTWQGQSITLASLFVFRGGKLIEMKAPGRVGLDFDNSGAAENKAQETTITSSWRVQGDELIVSYDVSRGGRRSRAQAVWTARGDMLALTRGAQPKELEDGI